MPLNPSIQKVLVIGAGPIIIGQACEFDYSGTQACKAIKEEGCQVVLINSNPATIMTDPGTADAVYIEPITCEILEKIIQQHRPDSLLPTMGGQTALNSTLELHRKGILQKYEVRLIGLQLATIEKAEDRQRFKEEVTSLGLEVPRSFFTHNWEDVLAAQNKLGFPLVVRTSFTLGGEGGGLVYTIQQLKTVCEKAFQLSQGLLIEESVSGWKEYELEVMRDTTGNCIVVCGIENLDPMGIHTGDSITIAPIQTLTDKEYQWMRTAAFKVMEAIGMTSGGCNVQFAVHPTTGKVYCIEINPRVSRSSALASKATGFPIAKIATKIALGYNLHELQNNLITTSFPSSFEPVIDYVVTKIPRFNFDKFPEAEARLTTHMKSIGEVMAIGRTFKESLLKAISSLDLPKNDLLAEVPIEKIRQNLRIPSPERLFLIFNAFRHHLSLEDVSKATGYDPWFLSQIQDLVDEEQKIKSYPIADIQRDQFLSWKRYGFTDEHLAYLLECSEQEVRDLRWKMGIHPTYKRIDTCAAEFPNETAYMYSTYEQECESSPSAKKKVAVLGSGPNRIGQGIEFDYCCVHAVKAIKDMGYETIIINCNPETVSTDYDIANRLYFDPLTAEHVIEILRIENPIGTIIQMGGQTPLKIGKFLHQKGIKLLGTSFDSTDIAEDREKFRLFAKNLRLKQPDNDTFSSYEQAFSLAEKLGYPLVVRPSFVIGGSSIAILSNNNELQQYLNSIALETASPILIEKFLENGLEVEVDAICDGTDVFFCGIVEHLDPTGIHSGDSVCFLSPYTLSLNIQHQLKEQTKKIGLDLRIIGLFNVQFAIHQDSIMILEVNPRASRTVPLLSKTTGLPLVQIATKCILGHTLKEQQLTDIAQSKLRAIKLPVFPFARLLIEHETLGPQMKSTGEVLCIGKTFDEVQMKARLYMSSSRFFSKKSKEEFLSKRADSISLQIYQIPQA